MLDKYLQIESLAVVFIGDFNPVIFQPFWLSNKKLVRDDEAKNAKVEIIHNEIVKYELDWVNIEVTRNRCLFKTSKEPYFGPLKDLIVGIFKVLNETPINSFGLNHIYDLSMQTKENYYNFGSALTPLELWKDSLEDPRLMQLEIFEKERADGQKGTRRVRITPTADKTVSFGVTVNVNNHFEIITKGEGISLLEKNWDNSFTKTKEMIENFLNEMNFKI